MTHAINIVCGRGLHHQMPKNEPVFHFIQKDGYHGVTDLRTIRTWARSMREDGVPREETYRELYVILPGGVSLLPCTLAYAGADERLKLVIVGTASVSGMLYTCDL